MWDLGGCHLGWHLDHRVGMVARQEVKGAGFNWVIQTV